MQQVRQSPSVAANNFLVNPTRLAVPQRSLKSRALVTANHVWVLHKKIVIQVMAGLLCAVLLAAAFQARGGIMQATETMAHMLSGKFASAGFAVTAIDISGQSITRESDILHAIGMDDKTSTLNLDAEAARKRIEALPAIKSVSLRKVYPGRLIVSVTEKQPVVRWRVDGKTYLIDAAGEKLGEISFADDSLPLVIGEGAAQSATAIIRAIDRHPLLKDGLFALSRIADRRWDMIYDTGLRVQLPESGVGPALDELEQDQTAHQLLDRDLSLIDMRVAGQVVVQLVDRSDEDHDKTAGQDS